MESQPGVEIELACHPKIRDFLSRNLKSPIHNAANPLMFIGKYFIGYIPLDSAQRRKIFFQELYRAPRSIWKQFSQIRAIKPDIVHLNSSVMFAGGIAAYLAGIPIVWHVREPVQGERWKQKVSGWIIRRLARKIITISEVEAARLGNDRFHKINVIYNPLNMDTLREELYDPAEERRKLGLQHGDRVIATLGGAVWRKGALEQVQAMKYTNASTRLVIAGPSIPANSTDEYHQKMLSSLAELPSGKVIFTGIVENVAPLLAACDVLTFTARSPHFPRPVFEAWLMKKPVVVFDMEGVSNQVTHGVNGIIVKELTGQALGMALTQLLQDPASMKKMGETGRQKAEEKCNPASVAKQVLSVYHEVLGR